VKFVSGVGDDELQNFVVNSLVSVNVSPEYLFVKQGERTAAFTGLLDKNGDFFCGVADMTVAEYIPVAHLEKTKFWEAWMLILDSNIGHETLTYVLQRAYQKVKHIIYEPISQEKSERILTGDLLSRLTIFKPNLVQLVHLIQKINGQPVRGLTNVFAEDKRLIKLMILKLAEYAEKSNPKGNNLKQIILTLGKDGVLVYSTSGKGTFTHYAAR
jgi:sugar/nucleoside kinase (ribokinase family)